MSSGALSLDNVTRTFVQGGNRVEVLRGVSLTLNRGEVVALVGPSGAGKSTLLHVAGLLEQPDGGSVTIGGAPCGGLGDSERTRLRRDTLGFVYQSHHLLPEFNALENVMMPGLIQGKSFDEMAERAERFLTEVGLEHRLTHPVGKLSGGERQRVAVGRALVLEPEVVLADEPTGNLDPKTGDQVLDLLMEMNRTHRTALVVVTHSPSLARRLGRQAVLTDGYLAEPKAHEFLGSDE